MFECFRELDYLLSKVYPFVFRLLRVRPAPCQAIGASISKIICIKLWGLGNLTIIYPLLYKIKEKFPQAKIIFLTFDLNKDFLENNQAVDKIVYFRFTRNIIRIIGQFFGLLRLMKQEKADAVINFEQMNNLSGVFSRFLKPPVSIGINNNHRNLFYDYAIDNKQEAHISGIFSGLLAPLGIESPYRYADFIIPPAAENGITGLFSRLGIGGFVCIHPSTSENFKGKRYKKQGFSELAGMIIAKYNIPVLFTGTESDNDLIEDIIRGIAGKDKALNLSGKLRKWEFVELLRKSRLIISNDTWTAHIAASLGRNLAVFYGPSSPIRYGPLHANGIIFYKGLPCSPCIGGNFVNKKCKNCFSCLDFPPQEVFARISGRFFNG